MAQLVAHHTGSVGVRGSNPLSSTRFSQFSGMKRSYVDSDVVVRMTSVIAASIHAQKNSTGNTLPSQASVQNALAMVASLAVDDYRAAGAHRPREAAKPRNY
jgi:hypothetical protein